MALGTLLECLVYSCSCHRHCRYCLVQQDPALEIMACFVLIYLIIVVKVVWFHLVVDAVGSCDDG